MTDKKLIWDDYDFRGDMVAVQKFITGEWYVKPTGEIFNKFDRPIIGSPVNGGYLYVGTTFYGLDVNVSISRAVWIGTHGGRMPRPGYQIDHGNGNNQDNRPENLYERPADENCQNPNTKRTGCRHSRAKLTPEQHATIMDLLFVQKKTCHEVGRIYQISPQQISRIKRGLAYKKEYKRYKGEAA